MLTAWLTCSQHLFLWVLKIKEESAARRYLSPRPLCVSGSPETCPALLYGIWIGPCTLLTCQLISPCPNIPMLAVGTGEHPQCLPDVRGSASRRDVFVPPQAALLPVHGFVWTSRCLCEVHVFLLRSVTQEWSKLCLCSVGALAALSWRNLYSLLRQLNVS